MERLKIIASFGGGIIASFAMDVVQDAWARAFERERRATDRDEEVEALASVVRALATFDPSLARGRRAWIAARALHYAFGVAFACAYVAFVPRARVLASAGGVAFGTGLFVLSDRILIPMLDLGRSWDRYSPAERANALVSHVAYGVALEAVRACVLGTREEGA